MLPLKEEASLKIQNIYNIIYKERENTQKWEQRANMAPRHRVCHSLANARLISRLMSPSQGKDGKLLPVRTFPTNRGHSEFS